MKKYVHYAFCCLAFGIFSPVTLAGGGAVEKIKRIASSESGTAILWAEDGWGSIATNSCSTGTGVLAFDSTTPGGKSMLSLATAAYMGGKSVKATTVDDACLDVGGMAPLVARIDVLN